MIIFVLCLFFSFSSEISIRWF